ncbi:MAG: hypothetical protein F7C08_04095 [Desulfurococcales archaeon]|nr:hypothetical protein [Desulfurococcales archaeon]MCE4605695.1 hypothetical protein [Desulfurococcales archaeon]
MQDRIWLVSLIMLQLGATLATAQVNLTITPQAPPIVESIVSKILGLIILATAIAGVLALLWGCFKMSTGQEGAGKWLVVGVIAIAIAFCINYIAA